MRGNQRAALGDKASDLIPLLFRNASAVREKQNSVGRKLVLLQLLVENNVDQQMRLIQHLEGAFGDSQAILSYRRRIKISCLLGMMESNVLDGLAIHVIGTLVNLLENRLHQILTQEHWPIEHAVKGCSSVCQDGQAVEGRGRWLGLRGRRRDDLRQRLDRMSPNGERGTMSPSDLCGKAGAVFN